MAPRKTISSAPEAPDGPGYVTESEAVSDLIGSTALIANTLEDFNGSFCRIEAFDPQVRP